VADVPLRREARQRAHAAGQAEGGDRLEALHGLGAEEVAEPLVGDARRLVQEALDTGAVGVQVPATAPRAAKTASVSHLDATMNHCSC
jgi:hypothetical protein